MREGRGGFISNFLTIACITKKLGMGLGARLCKSIGVLHIWPYCSICYSIRYRYQHATLGKIMHTSDNAFHGRFIKYYACYNTKWENYLCGWKNRREELVGGVRRSGRERTTYFFVLEADSERLLSVCQKATRHSDLCPFDYKLGYVKIRK